MSDGFHLGAYWGSRPEPVEDCADKLARSLDRLAVTHALLSEWFKRGSSEADALRWRISTSRANLVQLLQAGHGGREMENGEFVDLGFHFGAWNGSSSAAGLNVRCGAVNALTPNVFVVNFPSPDEALELHRAEKVRAIFESLVEIWNPDWAIFATSQMREWQGEYTGKPQAGWLTYLNDTRVPSAAIVPGIERIHLGPGVLFVAGPDPYRPRRNTSMRSPQFCTGMLATSIHVAPEGREAAIST